MQQKKWAGWKRAACSLCSHDWKRGGTVKCMLQKQAPVVAVCYDFKLVLDGEVEESPVLKPVFLNHSLRHPMIRD